MPRPASLSFEILRTFVLLMRNEGDASRTAAQLGINQPSVSKRLRSLQHAGGPLARPWLRREGKLWKLTDEGRAVFPAAEELVRRYEQLTDFVHQPEKIAVRLGCGQRSVLGFVRVAIRRFRQKCPNARLRISTMRGRDRIEGVAAGLLDLAIVSQNHADIKEIARRPLVVEPLTADPLVVVSSAAASWKSRFRRLPEAGATAKSLADYPLILPEPNAGIRKTLERPFRNENVWSQVDVVLEIGGWAAMLSYVHMGLGVALVTSSAVSDQRGVIVRPLDPHEFPGVQTKLICRQSPTGDESLDLSPDAEILRAALRDAARAIKTNRRDG